MSTGRFLHSPGHDCICKSVRSGQYCMADTIAPDTGLVHVVLIFLSPSTLAPVHNKLMCYCVVVHCIALHCLFTILYHLPIFKYFYFILGRTNTNGLEEDFDKRPALMFSSCCYTTILFFVCLVIRIIKTSARV